ncbi:GNAT family N-acetyltransferase [Pseudidiomarina homiensis]|uniref:N-acetyltransferase domain-containing protein n=1 Tax=Pseudidiomarina homiensis TaxID=364198 RepID=A0A432Y2Q8_9GAMM|nr:GNAT family N-acetyltransferase [Pseudidiomarina homiensis]RUO55222.1 hypothetical protein CWI70_00040 [Pseudidiomarina homiensis]
MFEQQLEHWLEPFKAARQRAVFIFSPAHQHERDLILDQLTQLPSRTLWLSDSARQVAQMHRYRDYLGQNTQHVVLDFQQLIHADALAALAGTVRGGGCLWLVLPPHSSCFQQRLLIHAEQITGLFHCARWQDFLALLNTSAPSLPPASPAPSLPSQDQEAIINTLLEHPTHTHVLMADRGRGKSTTLGLAIRQAKSTKPIVVTGPRPSALTTLLQEAGANAEFRAWDRLLGDASSHGQTLVIDEAAAIPLHCLQALCNNYQVWAVATTVEGYEGCGQGFVLRFLEWLTQHFQIIRHQLTEPLRWANDDCCETWLNRALLMVSSDRRQRCQPPSETLRLQFCHASQLDESALAQVMALLLEAHYQSSPNDLRLLLDDPDQHLLLACDDEAILGVTWLATEGPIANDLHTPIMRGERRIKGQLLPQALGFYRQQAQSLGWAWWRIVRIAVAPQHRRQRIGAKMLSATIKHAQQHNVTAIGTSFGVTPEVECFWSDTPLQEVRRGLKKNAASGTVSALWAFGLAPEARAIIDELATLQRLENAWTRGGAAEFAHLATPSLAQHCLAILQGFCGGALPFSDARFAWWLLAHLSGDSRTIARDVLQSQQSTAELVRNSSATSRTDLERKLRQEAALFLRHIDQNKFL